MNSVTYGNNNWGHRILNASAMIDRSPSYLISKPSWIGEYEAVLELKEENQALKIKVQELEEWKEKVEERLDWLEKAILYQPGGAVAQKAEEHWNEMVQAEKQEKN